MSAFYYEPANSLATYETAQELLLSVQFLTEDGHPAGEAAQRWARLLLDSMEGRGLIRRVIREAS